MAKEIDAQLVFSQLAPAGRTATRAATAGCCACAAAPFRGAAALAVEGALRAGRALDPRLHRAGDRRGERPLPLSAPSCPAAKAPRAG